MHLNIEKEKLKQYGVLGGGVLGLAFVIGGLSWALFSPKKTNVEKPIPEIATPSKILDSGAHWKEKIEQDSRNIDTKIDELLDQIQKMSDADMQSKEFFNSKLMELEQKLDTANIEEVDLAEAQSFVPEPIAPPQIRRVALNLTQKENNVLKTVDSHIPAGAFVEAVLLSGLDASASLNASSDPRPVLLRLTGKGNLPRKFKSDLKDCHLTASAYGDLSSERVFARLEKLSCTEVLTGELVETEVAGFIAGSDGRAGIRGIVISKEGPYLSRSLIGGVLSGLSDVANPENQRTLTFGGGGIANVDPLNPGELFVSGVGRGTSKALNRLADYYINRAEQLQPVVEIPPGQEVTVIFTEGVFFGSSAVKQELSKNREIQRQEVAVNNAQSQALLNINNTKQTEGGLFND